MTTDRINLTKARYRKMATATRRAANQYYKRGMKYFSEPDEQDMRDMYHDDRTLLRKFATLVNQGSMYAAGKIIHKMDTAVYEVIPARTYNYVVNSANNQR